MKDENNALNPRTKRLENALSKAFGRTEGPKNQHYVTRAYQELFFGMDSKISVYDRKEKKSFLKGRDGVASLNELYAFIDDHGRKRFDIEHALSVFESEALPIIKRLCEKGAIDASDRTILSWFMAINLLRTPQALDEILNAYKSSAPLLREHFGDEAAARKFFEEEQKFHPLRAAEIAAYIFEKAVLRPGRQTALGLFFSVLPIVYRRIDCSHWQILESPDDDSSFVLSDCGLAPIAADNASKGNFLAPGMQLAFPLSPRFCLIASGSQNQPPLEYRVIDSALVGRINEATAWASKRHVMGLSMRQLQEIVRVFDERPADWIPVFLVE